MAAAPLLPLVLLSAFLHALWNALIKRDRDPQLAAIAVLAWATLIAGGVALGRGNGFAGAEAVSYAVLSGLSEAGYFAALALLLGLAPYGKVYSHVRGLAVLALWPLSLGLLGETTTWLSLSGAGIVVLGLFANGASRARPPLAPGTAAVPSSGTRLRIWLYAVVCALCIAGYNLFYKRALEAGAEPLALFAASLAIALPVNVALLGRTRARGLLALGRRWLPLGLAGLTCCLSFWLFLLCLERAGAAKVTTLRNTSVLFAQGLAWWLGEPLSRSQWLGAALVALGAAVLSWGG